MQQKRISLRELLNPVTDHLDRVEVIPLTACHPYMIKFRYARVIYAVLFSLLRISRPANPQFRSILHKFQKEFYPQLFTVRSSSPLFTLCPISIEKDIDNFNPVDSENELNTFAFINPEDSVDSFQVTSGIIASILFSFELTRQESLYFEHFSNIIAKVTTGLPPLHSDWKSQFPRCFQVIPRGTLLINVLVDPYLRIRTLGELTVSADFTGRTEKHLPDVINIRFKDVRTLLELDELGWLRIIIGLSGDSTQIQFLATPNEDQQLPVKLLSRSQPWLVEGERGAPKFENNSMGIDEAWVRGVESLHFELLLKISKLARIASTGDLDIELLENKIIAELNELDELKRDSSGISFLREAVKETNVHICRKQELLQLIRDYKRLQGQIGEA